jgi:hypothetical protein
MEIVSIPLLQGAFFPGEIILKWGGCPFIHMSGPGSYFFGSSFGQGDSFPLGYMSSPGVNPFGGMLAGKIHLLLYWVRI